MPYGVVFPFLSTLLWLQAREGLLTQLDVSA